MKLGYKLGILSAIVAPSVAGGILVSQAHDKVEEKTPSIPLLNNITIVKDTGTIIILGKAGFSLTDEQIEEVYDEYEKLDEASKLILKTINILVVDNEKGLIFSDIPISIDREAFETNAKTTIPSEPKIERPIDDEVFTWDGGSPAGPPVQALTNLFYDGSNYYTTAEKLGVAHSYVPKTGGWIKGHHWIQDGSSISSAVTPSEASSLTTNMITVDGKDFKYKTAKDGVVLDNPNWFLKSEVPGANDAAPSTTIPTEIYKTSTSNNIYSTKEKAIAASGYNAWNKAVSESTGNITVDGKTYTHFTANDPNNPEYVKSSPGREWNPTPKKGDQVTYNGKTYTYYTNVQHHVTSAQEGWYREAGRKPFYDRYTNKSPVAGSSPVVDWNFMHASATGGIGLYNSTSGYFGFNFRGYGMEELIDKTELTDGHNSLYYSYKDDAWYWEDSFSTPPDDIVFNPRNPFWNNSPVILKIPNNVWWFFYPQGIDIEDDVHLLDEPGWFSTMPRAATDKPDLPKPADGAKYYHKQVASPSTPTVTEITLNESDSQGYILPTPGHDGWFLSASPFTMLSGTPKYKHATSPDYFTTDDKVISSLNMTKVNKSALDINNDYVLDGDTTKTFHYYSDVNVGPLTNNSGYYPSTMKVIHDDGNGKYDVSAIKFKSTINGKVQYFTTQEKAIRANGYVKNTVSIFVSIAHGEFIERILDLNHIEMVAGIDEPYELGQKVTIDGIIYTSIKKP